MLLILPIVYSAEFCTENLASILAVNCSEIAAPASNYNCSNIINGNLSSINGEWVTTNDIPPSVEANLTVSAFDFNKVEVYARGLTDVAQLQNFTLKVSHTGENSYETIIDQENFQNDSSFQACRGTSSSNWLYASNQPYCIQYNFSSEYNDITNIQLSVTDTSGGLHNLIVPEIMFCYDYNVSGAGCTYPKVWCDNFNYDTSLYYQNNWNVLNTDNSLNTSYTPKNNKFELSNVNGTSIRSLGYFGIEAFPVNYQTDEGITVTSSIKAPVFSIEYEMGLSSESNDVEFNTYDLNSQNCIQLIYTPNQDNITISFINTANEEQQLGIVSRNITKHKIIAYFGYANKTYDFNSSVKYNQFDFYYNGSKLNSNRLNFSNKCINLHQAFFIKDTLTPTLRIDDYYHYVGIDKNIDTINNFFSQFYKYENETSITTIESGDISKTIDDFWSKMGLKTQRSRTLFGLLILVLFTIAIIGGLASMRINISVGVILLLDFLLSILLTFLKLFPVWIIISITIIGIGLGALIVKQNTG